MRNSNWLLVDDDEAYHMLVPDVLAEHGHTVDVASNPQEALEYIGQVAAGEKTCHGVILDFHLDGQDATRLADTGEVVLAGIREYLGSDMPVIGFSARSMETHGIDDLHVDATKDGLFALPTIIASIPEPGQA